MCVRVRVGVWWGSGSIRTHLLALCALLLPQPDKVVQHHVIVKNAREDFEDGLNRSLRVRARLEVAPDHHLIQRHHSCHLDGRDEIGRQVLKVVLVVVHRLDSNHEEGLPLGKAREIEASHETALGILLLLPQVIDALRVLHGSRAQPDRYHGLLPDPRVHRYGDGAPRDRGLGHLHARRARLQSEARLIVGRDLVLEVELDVDLQLGYVYTQNGSDAKYMLKERLIVAESKGFEFLNPSGAAYDFEDPENPDF